MSRRLTEVPSLRVAQQVSLAQVVASEPTNSLQAEIPCRGGMAWNRPRRAGQTMEKGVRNENPAAPFK